MVKINYYGIEAEGRNVTDAKRKAGKIIESLVEQNCPSIYRWGSHTIILHYTPTGWGYVIACPDGHICRCITTEHDHCDALGRAMEHASDFASDAGEREQMPANLGEKLVKAIRDRWAERDAWQGRYSAALQAGRSEHEAHTIACGMGHLLTA